MNPYLFKNSTTETSKEANELRKVIRDKANIHTLSFELNKVIKFDLGRYGVSGLKKLMKKVDSEVQNTTEQTYVVVGGNTFEHKDYLKTLGFKITRIDGMWLHYKGVLVDKADHWINSINENTNNSLSVLKTNNPEKAVELINEVKELEKEESIAKSKEDAIANAEQVSIKAEITKWFAKTLSKDLGNSTAFRNIEITRIYRETDRAMLVDAKFNGGISVNCGCCGRALNNDISRATGIGPICAVKMGLPRPTMENAKEVVAKLEEAVKEMKQIEQLWIPKSQVTIHE